MNASFDSQCSVLHVQTRGRYASHEVRQQLLKAGSLVTRENGLPGGHGRFGQLIPSGVDAEEEIEFAKASSQRMMIGRPDVQATLSR
jgi:hypothetical protein